MNRSSDEACDSCHRGAGRARPLPAAVALLGALSFAPAVAQALDVDFAAPLNVIGTRDIVAAPAIAPGDILELRAGPGPDPSSVTVATLVRGLTNTTAITVMNLARTGGPVSPGQLDLNAIPQSAISNVQAFSLGGGCRTGSTTVFPFVQNLSNNFRPFQLRVTNGVPSVSPLAIAGSDNIHSIECTSDANGNDVYYAVANATQARVEVWKQTGASAPVPFFNNLPQLLSPFNGGARPIMASIESSFFGAVIVIQYQRTNGQISNYYVQLTPVNLAATCLLFTQSPVPNTFTVVREGRIISLRNFTGVPNSAISASDPDRNGTAELVRTPVDTCAPTLVDKGSAAGGNGFNWTGFGGVANAWRGWAYVGNGTRLTRVDVDSTDTQVLTTPLLGPGGPYDFAGGIYAEDRTYGLLQLGTKPGAPRELRVTLSAEYRGDGRFAADFEGPALQRVYGFNQ
ncbi:MAG TPA: hypothetical protein VFL14_00240 [Xanthomonadales bacterium]|nr:hypothetical protein [Xanthomonadales bacterium]